MGFATLEVIDAALERAAECLQRASRALNRRDRVDERDVAAIQERFGSMPLDKRFDVFLSYATTAADKALGVWQLLTELPDGFRVYMDWIYDPLMEHQKVSQQTAAILRRRMQGSQCLIYVVTESSQQSVWMPWELGYFDAYKANVGILPVLENDKTAFSAREYLSLYRPLTLEDAAAMTRKGRPSTFTETLAEVRKLAEVAEVNPLAFARQMQDQPQLAGEWLRPHARQTIAQGPELSALHPDQTGKELKSIFSIYQEEWMKMLQRLSGG